MVEAELFGHKRGAFTGAIADRQGKVQAADKGTLFLDEIGELPLEIQPKLLRLLQEKTYERVGEAEERTADTRVIVATNRDLELEVQAGRFRRDLYERLHFIPIRIPPLRERPEDIGLLLRHCLDLSESGRWIEVSTEGVHVSPAARFLLARERAALGAAGGTPHHRGPARAGVRRGRVEASRSANGGARLDVDDRFGARPPRGRPPKLLEDAERMWLEEALRRYARLTRAEVAERLKISESALYKEAPRVRHLGLSRASRR